MFANNFGQHSNVCCGLVKIIKAGEEWMPPKKTPIPLISVNVNASVVHAVAQVEVTQVYVNKEEQPIEAIYYFPVNPEGAVTHFQAELEGRVIKGTVKKQEDAKKEYDEAVEDKRTAFMGEETKADIFKVRVGFLKPGAQVKVIIGYVTEVKNEPGSNAIRFYIPTTIAPRYVSKTETEEKAKDIKSMEFSEESPAPLSLKVAVSLQGGIKSIESPTHKVKVEKAEPIQQNSVWQKAIVELSGETTDMDRDFVLNIVPEDKHKPRLYSEKTDNGSTALMVHLVPSFKLDEQKTELIFVLDRSGSMMGQSIDLARKALLLFLHSMPADCYFNVVGFGSTYQFLFPTSVQYDDGSLKKAIAHAKGLQADLGGTEILQPLKEIYGKPGIDGYLRQLFVLTDGEVSNTDGVIGIAQANANKARVFALGIGDGASHHLVEGIAKAGGGSSAFVTYNETIDKKVLNQLKNGLQPSLTDIELEWEGLTITPDDAVKVAPVVNKEKTLLGYNKPMEAQSSAAEAEASPRNKQSPKRIPPVYDGSQLLVFGLFKDEWPKSVSIKAQSPDGPLTVKVEHSPENDVGQTGMLHRLAAIKLVRELELDVSALHFQGLEDVAKEEEKLKNEIIEISCQNGITSRYTSFVAVDSKDDKPSEENWVMETRNVPSQFAHGWHGGVGFGMPMMAMACPPQQQYNYVRNSSLTLQSDCALLLTKSRSKRCMPMAKSGGGGIFASPSGVGGGGALFESGPAMRGFSFAASLNPMAGVPQSNVISADSDSIVGGSNESMEMDVEDSAEATAPLLQLISLQSFDGSYTLNDKLASLIGKSSQEIKDGATKYNVKEEVFATALAISVFTTKMAVEKDVWELIVMKARKWLAKATQAGQVEEIVKAAMEFLAA